MQFDGEISIYITKENLKQIINSSEKISGTSVVDVYSISGIKVRSARVNFENAQAGINISGLSTGVYVVKLEGQNNSLLLNIKR